MLVPHFEPPFCDLRERLRLLEDFLEPFLEAFLEVFLDLRFLEPFLEAFLEYLFPPFCDLRERLRLLEVFLEPFLDAFLEAFLDLRFLEPFLERLLLPYEPRSFVRYSLTKLSSPLALTNLSKPGISTLLSEDLSPSLVLTENLSLESSLTVILKNLLSPTFLRKWKDKPFSPSIKSSLMTCLTPPFLKL